MAIAVSPPAAPPPRSRDVGSQVAMLLELDELAEIATALAPAAGSWPGMTRPARRRWELMAVSDRAEAWVIAWPPGGAIELHDHGGSAGAVVVAAGELVETSLGPRPGRGTALSTRTIPTGGCVRFSGHHVHDIANPGATPAISVHVYAPRLTSMTYYRFAEKTLVAGPTVRYRFDEVEP